MKLQDLVEAIDDPVVRAQAPSEEYPAPWKLVADPMGPNTIYAANGREVAAYLNARQAAEVMRNAGQ